jgi:hypothetical protein
MMETIKPNNTTTPQMIIGADMYGHTGAKTTSTIQAPTIEHPMTLTKQELRALPLIERKAILEELINQSGLVRIIEETI